MPKPQIRDFVGTCLSQIGKPYIYGYEVNLDDPDPDAFDCSELVQWAGARTGVKIPDGSGNQYNFCHKVALEEGIKTYGALLFRGPNGSEHVAVSLGNGTTIEARGKAYGTNRFSAFKRQWEPLAGIIPFYNYTLEAQKPIIQVEAEILLENDVVDEVQVNVRGYAPWYLQVQVDGGVRVVDGEGKPLDNMPFVDYNVLANTGQKYYFGPGKNGGVVSYPGLAEKDRQGVRYFKRIRLG